MGYQTSAYDFSGRLIADLGQFPNVTAARQAMLAHSGAVDLPAGEPIFAPAAGVLEGWFIDRTEYLIEAAR